MWDELFRWLDEHYHGLAILIAGMGGAFAMNTFYNKWVDRVKSIEQKCAKIDDFILPKLKSIDDAILSLSASTSDLNMKFDDLLVYLKAKDEKMDLLPSDPEVS